jgi:hypothetical protein
MLRIIDPPTVEWNMVAKEPWEEKRIYREDVVSAWILVVVGLILALIVFGVAAARSCQPNHRASIGAGWASSSCALESQVSAEGGQRAFEGG